MRSSLAQTAITDLTLGTGYRGTLVGSGQAQLFQIDVPQAQGLLVELNDPSSADQNELYLKFGALTDPFRLSVPVLQSAPRRISRCSCLWRPPGTWYALALRRRRPRGPGTYTILATASDVFLTGSTPSRSATNTDTTLTLTGSGFDQTTMWRWSRPMARSTLRPRPRSTCRPRSRDIRCRDRPAWGLHRRGRRSRRFSRPS